MVTQLALTANDWYGSYYETLWAPPRCGCSLVKKAVAIIASPIAFPFLYAAAHGSRPYISSSMQAAAQAGKDLQERLQQLESTKAGNAGKDLQVTLRTLGPQKRNEAIKLIRQSRLDTLFEIVRLQNSGALTPERLKSLEKVISGVEYKGILPLEAKRRTAIQFGQAFEIKERYRDTHFVFLHAQAVPWMIYSSLVKAVVKEFNPKLNVHNFKFLRLPPDKMKKSFFTQLVSPFGLDKNVHLYLRKKGGRVDDEKKTTMEKLLSVDGYFFNNYYEESATHFLLNNYNIANKPDKILALSVLVLKEFCPKVPEDKLQDFRTRIRKIWELCQYAPCGNLFAICVPKDKVDSVVYRAHPFGEPCSCHGNYSVKSKEILELLQSESLPDSAKCSEFRSNVPTPQYRLFLPGVRPGEGIDIHCLSPLAKSVRQQMKQELTAIAKELRSLK